MKELTLVKQTENIQLGHLYEHIFCAHIDALFFKNHLFQQLDYSLNGTTYYGGVILVSLELYTEAAVSLAKQIPTLNIVFNEHSISTASSQLLAEKELPFNSSGYDPVKEALLTLHDRPWQNIDELSLLDTQTIRRKTHPYFLSKEKRLRARKLTSNIVLDSVFSNSNPELLPLFRQIAWLVTANLQHVLADTYGYFSLSDKFTNTKQKVCLVNAFNVANTHNVDLKDNLESCLSLINNMKKFNAFNRLATELNNISYFNSPSLAPNIDKIYEDTLMIVGAEGWKKIATVENCERILKHITIELQFGREKASKPLR